MNTLTKDLNVYLVGGAVRDRLLGLRSKDRDWVVVGSSPEEMKARGFRPVGKDFPVFLHPETGEEYALARKERKVGRGYRGFEFVSDPTVTVEQDLLRRDLTINAIAERSDGSLVDPCGGERDIRAKVLRHVSEAFLEDPVRVLRVARFAARFFDQGFFVADETMALMRAMVGNGEVDSLVAERVWQEIDNALAMKYCYRFVEVLRECGALKVILPEVDGLFGVPQNSVYHPEVDTGKHILLALQVAAEENASRVEMFAVLVHDLGKGLTPADQWPRHIAHEKHGLVPINQLCDRLRVPREYRLLAIKVCANHLMMHQLDNLKPKTLLKLIENVDGFRRPDHLKSFIQCCRADQRGRLGSENHHYPQGRQLLDYFRVANSVQTKTIAAAASEKGMRGENIKEAIRRARISAIHEARRQEQA